MSVSDDELRQAIGAHVRHDRTITDADRASNLSALNSFISRQERFISNMIHRRRSSVTFDCETHVSRSFYHILCQLRVWVNDVSDSAFELQLSAFQKTLYLAQQIRDYVVNTPHTIGDCDPLEAAARKRVTSDPNYQKMRYDRIRLLSKATEIIENHGEPAAIALLQTEVLVAIAGYEPTINYSKPCWFDTLLEEYIYTVPELAELVQPAAVVVAEGTPMALLSTLSELNLAIMNVLQINSAPARAVVYTSLVRILFAAGYVVNPRELSGDGETNARFLLACEKFSGQTVRALVLTGAIVKHFTPGLPIASLFKSKQVNMLKPMEMMTNPIDLLHYVHQILGTLATIFAAGEAFLSFDDTLTLLLALLSISPPVNAVALAAFVTKWDDVQLSNVLSIARNYFVAAVEQIVSFGESHLGSS
jgi:hypothetical protein